MALKGVLPIGLGGPLNGWEGVNFHRSLIFFLVRLQKIFLYIFPFFPKTLNGICISSFFSNIVLSCSLPETMLFRYFQCTLFRILKKAPHDFGLLVDAHRIVFCRLFGSLSGTDNPHMYHSSRSVVFTSREFIQGQLS